MAEILREVDSSARPDIGTVIPIDATSKARTPPVGPVVHKPGAIPNREYVSSIPRLFVSRYIQSLPQYIDDVTRDFGADLYERMLNEAQVYSVVNIIKTAVLADGFHITPAIKDQDNPEFERAKFWADFCEFNLTQSLPFNSPDKTFESFLYEFLDGIALGHQVAEIVYDVTGYKNYSAWYTLTGLKVKPRLTTSFVLDTYHNLIGLLGLIPGMGAPVLVGHIVANPDHLSNLLPRDKFMIFSFAPKHNDPRGRSILRPAYDPWWIKQQVKGQYLQFLGQFAGPSLWGTTPEGAQAKIELDSAGNPIGTSKSPEQAMVDQMKGLQNGSVAAFPFGTAISAVPVGAGGEPFIQAFDYCDRQIAKAVLSQTLATEEGEHMARAASDNHQDLFDIGVRFIRTTLGAVIKNQLFRNLVLINGGKEEALKYTPECAFGADNMHGDWGGTASVVDRLIQNPMLDQKQKNILLDKIGLPPAKQVVMPQQFQGLAAPQPAALPSPTGPAVPEVPYEPALAMPQPEQQRHTSEGAAFASFSDYGWSNIAEFASYASTQINLLGTMREAILNMAKQIADDDLFEKGRESVPHVTVKYGLKSDNPAEVAKLVAGFGPIDLSFNGLDVFETKDNGDVLIVKIEGIQLRRLNAYLTASLPNVTTHPEYKPHATIAYLKPGSARKYLQLLQPPYLQGSYYNLAFSDRDRKVTSLSLAVPSITTEDLGRAEKYLNRKTRRQRLAVR